MTIVKRGRRYGDRDNKPFVFTFMRSVFGGGDRAEAPSHANSSHRRRYRTFSIATLLAICVPLIVLSFADTASAAVCTASQPVGSAAPNPLSTIDTEDPETAAPIVDALEKAGLEDESASFREKAVSAEPGDALRRVLEFGGIICVCRTPHSVEDQEGLVFAWGAISTENAKITQADMEQLELKRVSSSSFIRYADDGGFYNYAFGNGYWAWANDAGEGSTPLAAVALRDLIDTVIKNAPAF